MRLENYAYDVYPKVVRAGERAVITLHPLYEHARFLEGAAYQVTLFPMEQCHATASVSSLTVQNPADGSLLVEGFFPDEQEYILEVALPGEGGKGKSLEFHIYAVNSALAGLKPYKGDFHIHSFRSDGKESPAFVAAACRKIGLDFMAVTDHHRYLPSLEAMRAFEGLPIDLRIYPGEEVHPPENPVHMINFGASSSINDRFADETYAAEVRNIAQGLQGFSSEVLRLQYASCLWCYDHIRQAGGLGVFCHPYWVTRHRYNVAEPLIERHFADLPFDAFELIGGFFRHEVESNLLQVARYHHEELTRGRQIPIVGSSDAHGCENGNLFGWYYTLLLAPTPALTDIISSVRGCLAVAVEALPGENPRIHGPFHLVKYAHFLLREVLPLHDSLCFEEGRLMQEHLAGNVRAAGGLQTLQGQVQELYAHLGFGG